MPFQKVFDRENEMKRIPNQNFAERKRNSDEKNIVTVLGTIAVIVLVIAIVIGIVWIVTKEQKPYVPLPYGNTSQISNNNQTINVTWNITANTSVQNIIKKAVDTKNESLCEFINNSSQRQSCYESLAEHLLSACLKVEDNKKMTGCITVHAVKMNSTEVCVNIQNKTEAKTCREKVDPCYYKVGSEAKICKALLFNDYNLCYKDKECIYNYTVTKKEITACGLLPETAEQFACIALVKKEDECAKLSLFTQRDYCTFIYAVRTDDYLWCTSTTTDSMYATWCYSHFASRNKNLSICDIDLSLNNRWDCYQNYSLSTGDLTGCANMHRLATTHKFDCAWNYAKMYGNAAACDVINDSAMVPSCYVGAIMNNSKLNYIYCKDVGVPVWKNKCYMQSAKNVKNETICNFIETQLERESCIAEVRKIS